MTDRRYLYELAMFAAVIILGLIFMHSLVFAQAGPPQRVVANNAFSVGEKLVFDVGFGPMNVGEASMTVAGKTNLNGHDVFQIMTKAKSNKYIEKLYKVDDRIVSYTDADGIYSVGIDKNLNEGGWKQQREFRFDHANGLAYSTKDTVEIPVFTHDILSAFYYVRTQDLVPGETVELTYYDNDKLYDLQVHVLKKQKVRVPAGTFDCVVIEPKLQSKSLFRNEGSMQVYLTDDERKMPVLMTGKLIIGSIVARLKKVEKISGAVLTGNMLK